MAEVEVPDEVELEEEELVEPEAIVVVVVV